MTVKKSKDLKLVKVDRCSDKGDVEACVSNKRYSTKKMKKKQGKRGDGL